MIERVVVPVDFSSESDRALVAARALASWAGAGLDLVTVAKLASRDDVEAQLAALVRDIGETATWRIVETSAHPEEALLTELRRSDKALWCVGSHARGALGELVFGSLSEDLVRHGHVPVVLVGPHADGVPTGRVLAVTLDGSEQSEAILPAAADAAAALGMTLRLLQVVEPECGVMSSDVPETVYLARAAANMPSIDPAAVDYDVLHGGHPARDIVGYVAAQPDVGMIALATRALRGDERLLHGSSAFDIAHRASVPVLILRVA
jgi:nucleotide-binding universal stress UspA family protein